MYISLLKNSKLINKRMRNQKNKIVHPHPQKFSTQVSISVVIPPERKEQYDKNSLQCFFLFKSNMVFGTVVQMCIDIYCISFFKVCKYTTFKALHRYFLCYRNHSSFNDLFILIPFIPFQSFLQESCSSLSLSDFIVYLFFCE